MEIDKKVTDMSEDVRKMFDEISGKYDLMNDILSFGIHRGWRKKTVRKSNAKQGGKVLDLATGTGDLAFAFKKAVGSEGQVTGLDFSPEMLAIARKKASRYNADVEFIEGDALSLPFEDNTFDISSIAFGIRNVDSNEQCLIEMARVVKPGGRVMVLEFGSPKGFFEHFYKFYSKFVIPGLGRLFSRQYAYHYLPETAAKYPCREDFISIMDSAGKFSGSRYYALSGGIAYLYIGEVV